MKVTTFFTRLHLVTMTAVWATATLAGCTKADDCLPATKEKIVLKINQKKIALGLDAAAADRKSVWIDLNGNQKQDLGESDIVFEGADKAKVYTVEASQVIIYGKVTTFYAPAQNLESLDVSANNHLTYLNCEQGNLKSLDLSKNTLLERVLCNTNQITSLQTAPTGKLKKLACYLNNLSAEAMKQLIDELPDRSAESVKGELQPKKPASLGGTENNVFTAEHLNALKAKGWESVE